MNAVARSYRLHLPPDVEPPQVVAFLRGLAGVAGVRPSSLGYRQAVCIETRVAEDEVSIVVTGDVVMRDALHAAFPFAVLEPVDEGRGRVTSAVELRLTRRDRPIRLNDPVGVISTSLAGLRPSAGEVVYQLVFTPLPYRDRTAPEPEPLLLDERRLRSRGDQRRKAAEPPFAVAIRLGAATGSHRGDRATLSRAIAGLRTLATPCVQFVPRALPSALGRLHRRAPARWSWPVVLSAEELAVALLWPVKGVVTPWPSGPARRLLSVPNTVPREGRRLGRSPLPGIRRPVAMSANAITRHLHVVGPTGVGKTTLLAAMTLSDVAGGRGAVVIDPKGDLTTSVLDRLPADFERDLIVLDPADRARPLGLNPLADTADREQTAEFLISLLHKLYARSWGPRTQDILHASLLTLAGRDDATLVDLPLLLTNAGFRRQLVARLDDPLGVEPFWRWFEALSAAEQAQVVGPVMNKLRQLLMRRSLRTILGQPTSSFDLRRVLDHRGVLLVNLRAADLGADAAHLLGALLVGQLWQAIRTRRSREVVSVVIDEFQDVVHLPTDLASVLAQSRSYGVGLTLAHQHLAQLDGDLRAAVLANARSRIVFQTTGSDARALADRLGTSVTPEDLANLPAFEAYAQLVAGSATSSAFSLATEPLSRALGTARSHRQRSRERYGRDARTVEQELRAGVRVDAPDASLGRRPRGGSL